MNTRAVPTRDAFIWPAVTLGDAAMILNFTAAGFLAHWRFGAEDADLAYVGGGYWLIYVPLAPLWARLGGRIGTRPLMLAGAATILLASLLLTQVTGLWQLVSVFALLGTGASAMWPNVEAALLRGRQGTPLRRRLAVFNVMWNSGLILGPLVGMWVFPEKQAALGPGGRTLVNAGFLTAALLAAGLLLCLALWRPAVADAAHVRRQTDSEGPVDPVRLRAFWLMAFIGNFMCYVVIGVLRHLYEELATHQWADVQAAAARHHALLAAMAAAGVLTYVVLYFAHRWHYRLLRYLAWQAVLTGGLLLVALTGSVAWSAVGFITIGCGTAFVYSGSLFYSVEGRDETTHMAGWHEAVLGAGSVVGLLLAGHAPRLLEAFGVAQPYWLIRSPYMTAAGLFAVGILVQLGVYAHHARRFAAPGAGDRGARRPGRLS